MAKNTTAETTKRVPLSQAEKIARLQQELAEAQAKELERELALQKREEERTLAEVKRIEKKIIAAQMKFNAKRAALAKAQAAFDKARDALDELTYGDDYYVDAAEAEFAAADEVAE